MLTVAYMGGTTDRLLVHKDVRCWHANDANIRYTALYNVPDRSPNMSTCFAGMCVETLIALVLTIRSATAQLSSVVLLPGYALPRAKLVSFAAPKFWLCDTFGDTLMPVTCTLQACK